MGHCNDCGAPCPHCIADSGLGLLSLDEGLRKKVERLLHETGARTNTRVNNVVSAIHQYDRAVVIRCFRVWDQGQYAHQGKDERYFIGILRRQAVAKQPKLEKIPGLVTDLPKEVSSVDEDCSSVHSESDPREGREGDAPRSKGNPRG